MLGLCWTPASVQGMQKVASTMPTNPEQLLGAILVRKDIFSRFETTMHDTCLDANNLLEYLFSLYNSTAAPAERENLPAVQVLRFMHKDTNCTKKSTSRSQHVFPGQPLVANSQFPHPNVQNRPSETRQHQAGINEGQRKKIKIDESNFQGNINLAVQHRDYNQSVSLKQFDNHSIFPGASSNQASSVKREVVSDVVEPRHAQSSSSLPPFSQICRQGSRPYSPAAAQQYSDALAVPQHKDGNKNFGLDVRVNHHSGGDIKKESDGALSGVLGDRHHQQGGVQNVQDSTKHAKKAKLKGSSGLSTDSSGGTNNGERTGRKKKTHQCFCGALFTRADNLKRHIRKCHEEKLEKLSGTTLESSVDNSGLPVTDEFAHAFPASAQEGLETQPSLNSHGSQQHHQQREEHHQQQRDEHQQQRDSHHHQQRDTSHHQHREDHHHHHQQRDDHHHQDNNAAKSTSGVKWSCFCGENFDDHYRLVQHTRTHENNI